MRTTANIEQLFIYPVKSLKGIALSESVATNSGLLFDRQWAIVDEQDRVLTQRNFPQMALIEVSNVTENTLQLSHPELDDLHISIEAFAPHCNIKIWKDSVAALKSDNRYSAWLQRALQVESALFVTKATHGETRQYFDAQRFNIQGQYFSDAAPFLITNTASLSALQSYLHASNIHTSNTPTALYPLIDMRHFRPNIVISGIDAFKEHAHSTLLREDGAYLTLVDACKRCSMITVDPSKGEFLKDAFPFKQLTKLNPMPSEPKAPAFGVNALLKCANNEDVTLRVGDTFTIS